MAIAIFISVNILVASNSTLLVPLLKKSLDNGKHGFTFSTDLGEVQEDATGSEGLQMSMVYLVAGLYLLAGIIYLISIPFVRIDMKKIQEADEFNLLTPLNTWVDAVEGYKMSEREMEISKYDFYILFEIIGNI